MLGYGIVGLALFLFVQARDVYPQLLLARIFFSLGGAATSTMVTAVLPSMIIPKPREPGPSSAPTAREIAPRSTAPSVSSELTITPARLAGDPVEPPRIGKATVSRATSPPRLAGLVGIFTGGGALVALTIFLPLPARFAQWKSVSAGQAVADSFYVVGSVALIISGACFIGLRHLRGEENKGWRAVLNRREKTADDRVEASYWRLLWDATSLGYRQSDVALAYIGGFVARASSVGITLFIPLFVNVYYIQSGLCRGDPSNGTAEMKRHCRQAYILAAGQFTTRASPHALTSTRAWRCLAAHGSDLCANRGLSLRSLPTIQHTARTWSDDRGRGQCIIWYLAESRA